MTTANLGTVYRLVYAGVNFQSGVAGITASVIKPNNAVAGVFPLVEFASPSLSGLYFYDFVTNPLTDPEGTYVFKITSPNESNNIAVKSVNFVKDLSGDGGSGGGSIASNDVIVGIIDCNPGQFPYNKNELEIAQGESRAMELVLRQKNGDPYQQLIAPAAIEAYFQKTDGTILTKTLADSEIVVTDTTLGKLSVVMTEADTLSLRAVKRGSFQIKVVNGTDVDIALFDRVLTVRETLIS